MSNLVIVAIPEEQDRVWKISSEQVPHLTLLFLGDEETADTQQIVQFVEHAAQMSEHGPFYLDVDKRGVLGEDEADVVFFSKRSWNLKWIRQFRGQLLQNPAVRTAYDSTEQFPEWTPHLTLGYPETPAKEPDDDRGDHLYSVCFDRIAVWDGNFEGPEFELEWPERELEGDLAVAWSEQTKKALQHYGKKGMRWGQRTERREDRAGGRDPKRLAILANKGKSGFKKTGSGLKQVAKDVYFETDWAKDTATRQATERASSTWAEKDVPRLNAEYKGTKGGSVGSRLKNPLAKETIEYRGRSRAAYRDRLNEEVVKLPGNASGSRKYTIEDGGRSNANYVWKLKAVDVKRSSGLDHAATDEPPELLNFAVQPTLDKDGFIIGFKQVPMDDTLEQGAEFVEGLVHSVADVGEAFIIEHYGIKGMRWGFRRERPSAVTPTATSRVPHGNRRKTKIETEGGQNHPAHEDAIKVAQAKVKLKKSGTAALSNKELQDVANRVQLEERVKLLTSSKGKKFVKGELENEGKNLAKAGAKKAAKSGLKKAATAALV